MNVLRYGVDYKIGIKKLTTKKGNAHIMKCQGNSGLARILKHFLLKKKERTLLICYADRKMNFVNTLIAKSSVPGNGDDDSDDVLGYHLRNVQLSDSIVGVDVIVLKYNEITKEVADIVFPYFLTWGYDNIIFDTIQHVNTMLILLKYAKRYSQKYHNIILCHNPNTLADKQLAITIQKKGQPVPLDPSRSAHLAM